MWEEERDRGNASPEVEDGHRTRFSVRPARGRSARLVHGHSAKAVMLAVFCEEGRDALEKVRLVPAIVVRKRGDICCKVLERDVTCATKPRLRTQVEYRERVFEFTKARNESVVAVLVDNNQTEVAIRLPVERPEETGQHLGPADGREDEVDRQSCDHRRLAIFPLG